MIQKIAFGRMKVFMKPPFVLQDALHFGQNQFGQLVTFLEIGLSLSLLGRHFLQGHLFPNAFPQTGVTLINPCQFMKGNPTLLSLIVMTVHTVLGQKGRGPGLKLG